MSTETKAQPLRMEFKKSTGQGSPIAIGIFSSYSFERSVLTPASAFRFTAPGVDRLIRNQIRSGDTVTISLLNPKGKLVPIMTGFVDETDTHIIPGTVEYVISGRDTLGQLVDNTAVDAQNNIINSQNITLSNLLQIILKGTRVPQTFISQQVPSSNLIVQSNAGETKINLLQRYLDICNCLVWTLPNGQVVLGKPNFTSNSAGKLTLSYTSPENNNLLEARVRRSTNLGIRQIVAQLQTFDQVNPAPFTLLNGDDDMRAVRPGLVGRSVYLPFNYAQGGDAVNQATQIGNQSLDPVNYGKSLALREMARENMKVLSVECVVKGHVNENGIPYDVDQMYEVFVEDDDVQESMYVYSLSYELTLEHGMLTRLHLCKKNTIVSGGDALPRKS